MLRAVVLLTLLTTACDPSAREAVQSREALRGEFVYDPDLIPGNLTLELANIGDAAACVSRIEIEEGLILSQRGKRVLPGSTSSRAMLAWMGSDLIAGMTVIPPKRSVVHFYNLSGWKLAPGAVQAAINLEVHDCATFFTALRPKARSLDLRTTFNR